MSCDDAGRILANKDGNNSSEQFLSILAPGQKLSFKASSGKYFTAEMDATMVVKGDSVSPWQQFIVERHGDFIALRTNLGYHVSADDKGKVTGDKVNVSTCEQFSTCISEAGCISLLSSSNNYVTVDSSVRADKKDAGAAEKLLVNVYY